MLNKLTALILTGLVGTFLLVHSSIQAETKKDNTSTVTAPVPAGIPQQQPKKKASSGFQLFNLKLPKLSTAKKQVTYRLCAKRKGICKCQKNSDEPGVLTTMDPARCSPPPPPLPVVEAPALEDRKSIKEIQSLLKRAGYKPGPADGAMGSKTKMAIELYQGKMGLKPNGIPSAPLLASLRATPAKARVMQKPITPPVVATNPVQPRPTPVSKKAQRIIKVQRKLNHLGYKAGEPDGAIGSKTTSAISSFQKNMGLAVDGKISDKLLQRLTDLAPDDVSQPVYAGGATPNPSATGNLATPSPAKPGANPLAGLFGSLAKGGTSTNGALPSTMKGYRNCAIRKNKCLCQKLTDDPGVWTTMLPAVCSKRPSADGAATNHVTPATNAATSAVTNSLPTVVGKNTKAQENIAATTNAKTAGSSFFDSIAKVLTPQK